MVERVVTEGVPASDLDSTVDMAKRMGATTVTWEPSGGGFRVIAVFDTEDPDRSAGAPAAGPGGLAAVAPAATGAAPPVSSAAAVPAGNRPRAVRNNNPTNIKIGDPWEGLANRSEMTAEQRAEATFAVFRESKWGFRASAKLLQAYQTKHGLRSIRAIIARWAPNSDGNDAAGYARQVAKAVGVGVDDPIDVTLYATAFPMIKAMATIEAGGWFWSDQDLTEGLGLAGVA